MNDEDKKAKRREQIKLAQRKYMAKKRASLESKGGDDSEEEDAEPIVKTGKKEASTQTKEVRFCNHDDLHEAIKDLHKKFDLLLSKIEEADLLSEDEEEEEQYEPPKKEKKLKKEPAPLSDTEEEEEDEPPKKSKKDADEPPKKAKKDADEPPKKAKKDDDEPKKEPQFIARMMPMFV